jgi:hypothetical protein
MLKYHHKLNGRFYLKISKKLKQLNNRLKNNLF